MSETIPRALTIINEHNYERLLRQTDQDWWFMISSPKHNQYELNMMVELKAEHGLNVGVTDQTTEDGERIMASFEAGVTPQLFFVTSAPDGHRHCYQYPRRFSPRILEEYI